VVAAVAIVASGATERVLGAVTGSRRLLLWQSAVAMIRDHPLQGVGMDNFLYQYRERYILPEAWQEPDLSHPHNILLDFWTRLGVLGVVVIVWLQVVFWRRGLAAVKLLDGALAVAALALLASMTDFLVHGLIDNSFFLADLAVLFWFSWVLMGRLHAIRTQVSA
jgi:O-antigen ligase